MHVWFIQADVHNGPQTQSLVMLILTGNMLKYYPTVIFSPSKAKLRNQATYYLYLGILAS